MNNYVRVACDCGECSLCIPPSWTLTTTNTDNRWYVINCDNNLETWAERGGTSNDQSCSECPICRGYVSRDPTEPVEHELFCPYHGDWKPDEIHD